MGKAKQWIKATVYRVAMVVSIWLYIFAWFQAVSFICVFVESFEPRYHQYQRYVVGLAIPLFCDLVVIAAGTLIIIQYIRTFIIVQDIRKKARKVR